MPSSYSTSLRFELQFTGENLNLWGDKLNAALSRADEAIAGFATIPLSGPLTLSTANGSADQARLAMLKFTGTGTFTVTVPALSKRYDVWNACTAVLTLTNGSASVAVQPGEVVSVVTDGASGFKRVQGTDYGSQRITNVGAPTANSDAATKLYADNLAFTANAGILPGQTGNAGKAISTDGTTASWSNSFTDWTLTTPTIVSPTTSSPTITGGATLSGGLTLTGGLTFTGSTKQDVSAMSALDIDVSNGEFFTKSISAGSTFTFSNATASKAQAFILQLTISSSATPTWPGTVKWSGGVAPTLGNGTHLLGFLSVDGGTTWKGIVGGIGFA